MEFGILLEDCRFILRRSFNIFLVLVKKQVGFVAHCLARESRNYATPFYREYETSFIVNLLVANSA